jgi:hypothetical protein
MQTIKYNPNTEMFKAGAKVPAYGTTRLRLSAEAPLYIHVGAAKSLLGYGSYFHIVGPDDHHHFTSTAEICVIRDAPKAAQSVGEVYTNAEKKPMDSPAEQYVKQALRQIQLKQLAEKRQQKLEFEKMLAKRRKDQDLDFETLEEETPAEAEPDAIEPEAAEPTTAEKEV